MKITKSFAKDINDCYDGKITFDELIKNNKKYIKGTTNYFYNMNSKFLRMNNEDDLFQEACYWLLDSMWKWEPNKNRSLEEYVIYNIGARIQAVIRKEKTIKRGRNCKVYNYSNTEFMQHQNLLNDSFEESLFSKSTIENLISIGESELNYISYNILLYILEGYKIKEIYKKLYNDKFIQKRYTDIDLFKKDMKYFILEIKEKISSVIISQ